MNDYRVCHYVDVVHVDQDRTDIEDVHSVDQSRLLPVKRRNGTEKKVRISIDSPRADKATTCVT